MCGVGKYSGSGVYVFLHTPYSVCIFILNNGWKCEGIRHVYSVLFK